MPAEKFVKDFQEFVCSLWEEEIPDSILANMRDPTITISEEVFESLRDVPEDEFLKFYADLKNSNLKGKNSPTSANTQFDTNLFSHNKNDYEMSANDSLKILNVGNFQ